MQRLSIGPSVGFVSFCRQQGENSIVEILNYYLKKLSLAVQND